MAVALLVAVFGAPLPPPRGQRVELPAGTVRWTVEDRPGGPVARVTAGATSVEGRRLFYGDGRIAVEVVATPKGLRFVGLSEMIGHGEIDGIATDGEGFVTRGLVEQPGLLWRVGPGALSAGTLPRGVRYVITPSVRFTRGRSDKP